MSRERSKVMVERWSKVRVTVSNTNLGDLEFEQTSRYYGSSATDDRVRIANLLENVTGAAKRAYRLEEEPHVDD